MDDTFTISSIGLSSALFEAQLNEAHQVNNPCKMVPLASYETADLTVIIGGKTVVHYAMDSSVSFKGTCPGLTAEFNPRASMSFGFKISKATLGSADVSSAITLNPSTG